MLPFGKDFTVTYDRVFVSSEEDNDIFHQTCVYLSDYDRIASTLIHEYEDEDHLRRSLFWHDLVEALEEAKNDAKKISKAISEESIPLLIIQPEDGPLHQGKVRDNVRIQELMRL